MKKITALLLALVLVLSMAACGASVEDKLTEKANAVMKTFQEFDFDVDELEDLLEGEDVDFDTLFPLIDEDDKDASEAFIEFVKGNMEDMTYTVKSVNEDKLTVKVECEYPSASGFMDALVDAIFDGAATDDEDALIEAAIKSLGKKLDTETTKVTLTFKADGKDYKLVGISDDIADVLTCGVYTEAVELMDAFGIDLTDTEPDTKAEPDDTTVDAPAEPPKPAASGDVDMSMVYELNSDDEMRKVLENIEYEVQTCDNGIAILLTNNNDFDVSYLDFSVLFTNENDEEVYDGYGWVDCLAAGDTMMCTVGCYGDEDWYYYEIYNAECGWYGRYRNALDYITFSNESSGDEVAYRLSNNGSVDIDATIVVAYYKDGYLVGFDYNDEYNFTPGEVTKDTLWKPYSYITYEDLDYDNFKLYYNAWYEVDW